MQPSSWPVKGKTFKGGTKFEGRKYVSENEIEKTVDKAVKEALKQQEKTFQGGRRNRSKADIECYKCHAYGHYANECSGKNEEGVGSQVQEN